jgi:hypothetical protein
MFVFLSSIVCTIESFTSFTDLIRWANLLTLYETVIFRKLYAKRVLNPVLRNVRIAVSCFFFFFNTKLKRKTSLLYLPCLTRSCSPCSVKVTSTGTRVSVQQSLQFQFIVASWSVQTSRKPSVPRIYSLWTYLTSFVLYLKILRVLIIVTLSWWSCQVIQLLNWSVSFLRLCDRIPNSSSEISISKYMLLHFRIW